nr:toprim domain-containing protein [Pacificibacter marinus]
MLALVNNKHGEPVALHRTYLGRAADGTWGKANLPCGTPKKVLGSYGGAWINIWTGTGPRGGKAGSLTADDKPKHVYIAEGIEDALSGVCLLPDARFLSAISLSNMGTLDLPPCVRSVTLIADLDENATARKQLDMAVRAHQRAGRSVKIFQNKWGGKDLNDALRDVIQPQDEGQAHG